MDPTTPIPVKPQKNIRLRIIAAIGVIFALILLVVLFFVLSAKDSASPDQKNVAITGTFNLNGVIPSGASMTIEQIDITNQSQKVVAARQLTPVDQGTWSFDDAASGHTYEITASIVVNGTVVANATPITVTAPASEEILTINLPAPKTQGAIPTPAVISGNINVNGYIPTGATVTVQGKPLGGDAFTTIVKALPAQQQQYMTYTSAIAGQTYEIVGLLFDGNGNQIGSSLPLILAAPALNETLTINSQAVPPATPTPTTIPTAAPQPTAPPTNAPTVPPTPVPTPVVISGSINFNGVAPTNSRIVIFQRVSNTQSFQVAVNNVSPINGTTWQWTGATTGTWYDVIAILKQAQSNGTDQDLADSPIQTQAAPASNVSLTINSSIILQPPPGPISVSCGSQSGNTWNATVSYGPTGNAQSYWLQIGSSNGASDMTNSMQNTMNNNGNQTINVGLNNNQTYYARYAYATTSNAGQAQYSPFSSTTQFLCN